MARGLDRRSVPGGGVFFCLFVCLFFCFFAAPSVRLPRPHGHFSLSSDVASLEKSRWWPFEFVNLGVVFHVSGSRFVFHCTIVSMCHCSTVPWLSVPYLSYHHNTIMKLVLCLEINY